MTFARPAMAVDEGGADLVTRLWCGEVGLARTYWLWWVGGYFGWSFVLAFVAATKVPFLVWFGIFAACIYAVFVSVGLWRSASEYRRTHMALGWLGALVQAKIVLLFSLAALGLYLAGGVTPPPSAASAQAPAAAAETAPNVDPAFAQRLRAQEEALNASLPMQIDPYTRLMRIDYRRGHWNYHMDVTNQIDANFVAFEAAMHHRLENDLCRSPDYKSQLRSADGFVYEYNDSYGGRAVVNMLRDDCGE